MERTYTDKIQNLVFLGLAYGFVTLEINELKRFIQFYRAGVTLTFFYDKAVCLTSLRHPKNGFTNLIRKRVTLEKLEEILHYPRVHIGSFSKIIKKHDNK